MSAMEKEIVEVGMLLKHDTEYYHKMLLKRGFKLVFACATRDRYYTKQNLDGLTENQMKKACIRLRFSMVLLDETATDINELKQQKLSLKDVYKNGLSDNYRTECNVEEIRKQGKQLEKDGYELVFNTLKFDHHYTRPGMVSRIQIQEIEDVGVVLYYDNSNYYGLPLDAQREKLLEELNSYGFNFKPTDLGIDKLRTLYYHKKMYSKNQSTN